jgi:YD repeat-containing protein
VQPSKWLLLGLSAACLVAATRIGITAYEYRRSQAAAAVAERRLQAAAGKATEARSGPGEAVRQLLGRTDATAPRLDGNFPCVVASIEDSKPHPQVDKCALPTEHLGPMDRFEADLRYGSFVLRQSDLHLNDVFEVPLTRTYNSNDYLHPNPIHAFGKHANHPFDISPLGSRNPYSYQILVLEDGDFVYFPRVSAGTSFSDAVYQHTETSTSFYKAVEAWNGNGWTIFRTDGTAIAFPDSNGATTAAQGAPIEVRDKDGNRLELLRDAQRNLTEIRTPHQHSIHFKYDDQSRIVRAEDDQGHWAEYSYDSNSMLTDAKLSSGHARHYTYEGDLMTEIADENQKVFLRNSYNNHWLVRQDFGDGQAFSYSYRVEPTNSYADSATVTLPDGTKTTVDTGDSIPEARKHPPQ